MATFTFGDVVETTADAPPIARPGSVASVCGMTAGSRRDFPAGTIYLVAFPDGEAVEVHESFLRPPSKRKPREPKQFGQLAPETLEGLMDELRVASPWRRGCVVRHVKNGSVEPVPCLWV
jgi:hypothetical protein